MLITLKNLLLVLFAPSSLSIIYALMGFQRQSSCGQGRTLLSKALRTLQPIKRQILFQSSTSPFWTNLKLSILNNYVCIARECGKSVGSVLVDMRAMEKLLVQSRAHVDPVDLRKFYLSLQFMNVCTTVASAA